MLLTDLGRMDSTSLLDALIEAASERGILIADGASTEELENAQKRVDSIVGELMRRIAW